MRRLLAAWCAAAFLCLPAVSHAGTAQAAPALWLGIIAQDLNDDFAGYLGIGKGEGVLVSSVADPGPARKAGIRPGDVVQAFDGQSVASLRELGACIAGSREGAKVKVSVRRGKKRMVFEVKVAAKPAELAYRGMHVPASRSPLMISGIDPGSLAQEAGLAVDDVVLEVNGVKIDFPDDLANAFPGKGPALVRTARGYFLVKDAH